MLSKIIHYFYFGSLYYGIEHGENKDSETIFITGLKKSNKTLNLHNTLSCNSIPEVDSLIPKNQHLFLVINNNQVITKQIPQTNSNMEKLVNHAFPNLNISDFYYEIITQDQTSFISICRKDYVLDIINEYKKLGHYIVNFSLGNLISCNIINYLKLSSIYSSNAELLISKEKLQNIKHSKNIIEENYDINGLKISSSFILSFSGALLGLIQNYSPELNFEHIKSENLKLFKQVQFFKKALKLSSTTILTLLLINFIVFNYLYSEVQTLNTLSESNRTTQNKITTLKKRISNSKKISKDLLETGSSKSSYYINTIVQTLPPSVLLSSIDYQPLVKQLKQKKPISLNKSIISVSGETQNNDSFSKWITRLEQLEWVKSVYIDDFNHIKEQSIFIIKIQMLNDL